MEPNTKGHPKILLGQNYLPWWLEFLHLYYLFLLFGAFLAEAALRPYGFGGW